MKKIIAIAAAAVLLLGTGQYGVGTLAVSAWNPSGLVEILDEAVPLAGTDVTKGRAMKFASASGKTVYSSGNSKIDASNAAEGYVMVSQSGTDKRIKVQIIKGDKTYAYDLNNKGTMEIFPLQMGNGDYKIRIMQNVEGNKYTPLFTKDISVKLTSTLYPFLYPSQYVNYNAKSAVVKKAAELCSGKTSDVEMLAAVYKWIVDNVVYDYDLAKTVKSGYLPKPDTTLSTKKGICFDYAALMAAMLRSQGIPTRLICGTVSPKDVNHAWNEIYLEGKGWVTVKIYFEGSDWARLDPTFAAGGSSNIEQFIGDGSNYTGTRVY